ncbi:MAG: rhodanese-like domain-containing protein [Planctomycetaceae bacterium]
MTTAPTPQQWEIDCRTVHRRQANGENFLLLDCRERDEHATASIKGAVLVPMSEIETRLSELESYRRGEIIVHCHHGGRSLKVARGLAAQGFANVKSMAGGIDQWSTDIDQSIPRY